MGRGQRRYRSHRVRRCRQVGQFLRWAKRLQRSIFWYDFFMSHESCGSNGAIIHYKPTRGKDAKIEKDVYLLDAGAHYTCGTTDTTRVTHCGTPTEFQKECYTRVLMGHINLLQVVFPAGTRGPALDVLSRRLGLTRKWSFSRNKYLKVLNSVIEYNFKVL